MTVDSAARSDETTDSSGASRLAARAVGLIGRGVGNCLRVRDRDVDGAWEVPWVLLDDTPNELLTEPVGKLTFVVVEGAENAGEVTALRPRGLQTSPNKGPRLCMTFSINEPSGELSVAPGISVR